MIRSYHLITSTRVPYTRALTGGRRSAHLKTNKPKISEGGSRAGFRESHSARQVCTRAAGSRFNTHVLRSRLVCRTIPVDPPSDSARARRTADRFSRGRTRESISAWVARAIGDTTARGRGSFEAGSSAMATSQDLEDDWTMLCHDPDGWTQNGEARQTFLLISGIVRQSFRSWLIETLDEKAITAFVTKAAVRQRLISSARVPEALVGKLDR